MVVTFYDVQKKRRVTVPHSQVKYVKLKNGRRAAVTNYKGRKLYKIVG